MGLTLLKGQKHQQVISTIEPLEPAGTGSL